MPMMKEIGVCIDLTHQLTGLIKVFIMHLTLDIMFYQEVRDPLATMSWIYLQDIILVQLVSSTVITSELRVTPRCSIHQVPKSKLGFMHQSAEICTKLSE